ncbi:SMC family ATPase [Neobacillus cucumis]|uniref:SMC family ATPase n=1 Tax=Neobacillus cucumis TaxID=1740721 RepID=UPI002E237810|nr:SMC family ATPase [Neobacillus cucumis]
MKPIKLTMQAFGPYAEREEIDFNQLGNRTMFVISGKTGAGKTTIFDAISYAIYGKASGEDRNGPELRSQFAKDDLLTEVSLDFSLRNKVYSITRSPQQQKKKDRGDGFTTIGAKAELYMWDEGEKKLIASKTSDVEEKIKEIMLIDANQFRQILMIPQGEFRKLLTSDSKDKEVILQRLFHTQVYKLIEEKLKLEAAELKKTVEDQERTRNEALRRIQAVTNQELRLALEMDPENHILIMPLLLEEMNGMEVKLEQLSSQLTEKVQEQDKIKETLFEAEAILKQLQTKEELKGQKELLRAQEDVFSEKEIQVKRAQKAALLAKQEELCHRLKQETVRMQANINTIMSEIKTLNGQEEQAKQQLQKELDREDDRQAAQAELNQLANMKEDVYSFAALMKETNQKAAELKASKGNLVKDEQSLKQLEERIAFLKVQKEEIDKGKVTFLENKSKHEKLKVNFDRFEKLEILLMRHQKTEQNLAEITGRFENTVARYNDAKALMDELEKKWIHGQAAILAANLHNDEACPVCGSLHHPAPAIGEENSIPTEEDLKAAKEQSAKWEAEKSRVEANFYQCQSEEKTQKEAVEDILSDIKVNHPDFKLDELLNVKTKAASAMNELVQQQKKLQEQIQNLERFKTEIDSRENERGVLQNGIEQLRALANDLTVQFTKKETDLSRMMKVIPENLRSEAEYERALASSRNRHEMLVKQLEGAKEHLQAVREKLSNQKARLEDAEKHLAAKQKDLETERNIFIMRLSEQGFENYSIYAASKKTEEEIQSLQDEIRSYREEFRSVSDRLKELTDLLAEVKTPDVEGIKLELAKFASEIDMLTQERTDLFVKKRDNEEIYTRVVLLNNEVKALEERYSIIGDLSDIARGQNHLRITFERYVLAAFLDDILREANMRLRKMTSGRYRLQRKTDRSKGNVQSGLELLVFDQYTGQERHVKTLSGGESFKASLSLALGLADVVQNYAGGVSLETMFIDEGFGTLDPESLDQAIEALMDIQSSGRMVGIISHVPELKERIDVRLEVTSGQAGSRTEFMFTN